jgi:hypothetical protein
VDALQLQIKRFSIHNFNLLFSFSWKYLKISKTNLMDN